MAVINSKTTARIAAVQSLYQFEINGRADSAESLIKNIQESYVGENFKELFDIPENISMKLHNSYCTKLITTTIENIDKLDEIITLHLVEGWKYSNLHFSLVALLRVAIAEILYYPDTPSKVAVNEFTNIGASLAKQSEVAFINSLLDKICKEYRNEQ